MSERTPEENELHRNIDFLEDLVGKKEETISKLVTEVAEMMKGVPHNGFVLVPIEPTEAMIKAAATRIVPDDKEAHKKTLYSGVYKAMLEAAKRVG